MEDHHVCPLQEHGSYKTTTPGNFKCNQSRRLLDHQFWFQCREAHWDPKLQDWKTSWIGGIAGQFSYFAHIWDRGMTKPNANKLKLELGLRKEGNLHSVPLQSKNLRNECWKFQLHEILLCCRYRSVGVYRFRDDRHVETRICTGHKPLGGNPKLSSACLLAITFGVMKAITSSI